MITPDTVVVGVDPDDMSEDAFVGVLEGARSPALPEARESYRLLLNRRVSIAFLLAVFHHESQYATDPNAIVIKYGMKNPGNCRSPRIDVGTVINTSAVPYAYRLQNGSEVPPTGLLPDGATALFGGKGPFVKYPTWWQGWQDLAFRLVDPSYVYVREGRTTIREVITRFAPASDGNSPESYINAVVADMNRWVLNPAPPPAKKPKVDLAAGHRNHSGGNATEAQQTAQLTPVLAAALREIGCDVRVITPDEGRGHFDGDLAAVANAVRPGADLFLEVHTEGVGNPNVRGVFAIYPDWGDDVDVDVRDTLGPAIANAVSQATGLPVRGNGTMSEKKTGVGGQGYRLGVFGATAKHKATMTRLIVEYGAHSSPADMALWDAPDFAQKAARATAEAIATFYSLPPVERPVEPPAKPEAIELNGYRIVQGFRGFWQELEGYEPTLPYRVLGLPTEDEWSPEPGIAYQRFERGVLKWSQHEPAPWHIHLKRRDEAI